MKINRDDVKLKIDSQVLTVADAHITAALVYGLTRLVDIDTLNGEALKEQIGTMGDRWYAGCLRLATHAAPIISALIDWDDFSDRLGGVFTYEYVEVAGSLCEQDKKTNLSYHLFDAMTVDAWYELCENLRLPTEESVQRVIKSWAESAGIRLV